MDDCITFDQVTKSFHSGFRLEIRHLVLPAGERIGLVGNNGAGKTTLLLLALGLLRPEAGRIRVLGSDSRRGRSWRRAVASFLGESSLIPYLTPNEYLRFVGAAYGIHGHALERRLRTYEGFIDLGAGSGKLIRDHSLGNRKKIGLVAAMIVRPSLLILDEPFASLDPRSHAMLEQYLEALNRDCGTSLLISSHDLVHVVGLCSRITVIEDGRIVHVGASGAETLDRVRQILTRGMSSPLRLGIG